MRWILLGLSLWLSPLYAQQVQELRGRTPSGAWYVIQLPAGWQSGDGLVLVNHGYDFREPAGTPSLGPAPLRERQLQQGLALAASSYSDRGWALFSTPTDHRELLTVFRDHYGDPGPLISTGGSLGGLVALQQAEQPELGQFSAVYSVCTPAAGSRVWDHALDLRLIYDTVCDGVSGGELPRGSGDLPYAIDDNDLGDFDGWVEGSQIYLAINRCTGVDLPSWAISSGMRRRYEQIRQLSGVSDDFFLDNMAYATFGLSDLLRSEHKLDGRPALDNRFVDYGDADINQRIARIQSDRLAGLKLRQHHTPQRLPSNLRVLSTHTSGDGIVVPAHQQALQALLPAEQLSVAYVSEDSPSHCGYSDAELLAGWDALSDWLDGAPQPDASSLQGRCQSLANGADVEGPCRYDSSVQPEPLDQHLRPRQLPSFPLQAASTGLWYDPASPGDGYVIEALADGRAVVARFSYPAEGEAGDQAWFFGSGEILDEGIVIEQMQRPVGARFGAAFDPAEVDRQDWGEQRFVFEACGEGETAWESTTPYADGRTPLRQLSWIGGLGCPGSGDISGASLYSGAWYDPARSGEGGFIHIQADGRVFMLWFSFQPQGGQAWFFAEGSLNGAVITFADVLRPVGTRFGPDFVPADVRFERWGSARIELQVNGQIQLDYAADDSNWGAGTLHWQRLTQPLLP
ncbi:MAG: hypothetical protein R3F15_11475 [Lysobacterales bacterium]